MASLQRDNAMSVETDDDTNDADAVVGEVDAVVAELLVCARATPAERTSSRLGDLSWNVMVVCY